MNPVGKYTNVHVVNIQHGPGSLRNGTGTFNESGIFSCGDFDAIDLPKIGDQYKITGDIGGKTYEFAPYKCTHSGKTSDFKDGQKQ